MTYTKEDIGNTLLNIFFWCLSSNILTHPLSAFNGRCKLDHSCSKEQGLTIKQYKFPKLRLIHTPLDTNPCCSEHVVCTTAD